ncbi:hypothetical protein DLR68_16840 [Vibrio paracholerae]|nr:hypothetical protein DLR68_16840 [Vibrio paracholerae]
MMNIKLVSVYGVNATTVEKVVLLKWNHVVLAMVSRLKGIAKHATPRVSSYNKRLKRDCQRVAFPVPMSRGGYGCFV